MIATTLEYLRANLGEAGRMPRDRTQRKISKAIQANLDASRLSPADLEENIRVAKELRDTSPDHRVRAQMQRALTDLYKWKTDYEQPKDQVIQHEFPDNITINVVKSGKEK